MTLKKKKPKNWLSGLTLIDAITNPCGVLALGVVELNGEWIRSRLSIDMAKRALDILENMGEGTVDVIFTKDHPVIFGRIDKKKKRAVGVFIAPRIEED